MNMRKIIAVLSAVLMLCAIIPMGVSAAPGDVIIDADFNDGMDGFDNFSVADGALVLDGTSADWANSYAYANAIKPNTTYQVNFRAKADVNKALSFKINNGWTGGTNVEASANITTEWQEFELLLTPDSNLTSPIFTIQTGTYKTNGTVYYIDYVKVTEWQDPAEIGKVVNGGFEDGLANWTCNSSASLESTDASEGSNSLKLSNPGYYASAATQVVPVKANTVYELSWKSKRLNGTGAFNVILCQAASPYTNFTKVSGQNWMNETSGNWVNNSFTVNTGDNTSMLIKWTSELAGTAGEILLDDIKLLEIKDPSFDGYIYNGDFETGKSGSWTNLWNSSTVEIVEGRDGGYALKGTASGAYNIVYQEVNVTPNTDYTVWAYTKDASGSNLWIKNAGGNGDITNKAFASGEWALTSVSFNSGSNNTVWVGLMGLNAGSTYIVDDIFMFETQPESNDGYIKNGTFETGALTPWDNLWGSCPKAEVVRGGKDDNFALEIVSGQWKHVRQTNIAVEANTDYKISVWAKNAKNMSLLVKDNGDSANIVNKGISAGDEWTLFEAEFNSGANTAILVSFMGGAEEAYGTYDNIVMEKLHTCNVVEQERVEPTCGEDGYVKYACDCGLGEYTETLPATGEHTYDDAFDAECNVCGNIREVEIQVYDGKSVSEDVSGLAFKFSVKASGGKIWENTGSTYLSGSASIEIDGVAYALKYSGAVVSNVADIAADELTIVNAQNNGNKNIMNIGAKYLCDLSENSLSYAIRVINIPEANYDSVISARPYYTYENAEGDSITVYGDVVTGSYNG